MFKIRPATPEDAFLILTAHFTAVHVTAAGDYPFEVLDRWSPVVDMDRTHAFNANPDGEIRIVAESPDGKGIWGFGVVMPHLNELRACYVYPSAARRGVGTALVAELEKIAKDKGAEYLALDSSLTAEKFYLAQGYKEVERAIHKLRDGTPMACVKMRKELV
jgi:putative acetyltransferase